MHLGILAMMHKLSVECIDTGNVNNVIFTGKLASYFSFVEMTRFEEITILNSFDSNTCLDIAGCKMTP